MASPYTFHVKYSTSGSIIWYLTFQMDEKKRTYQCVCMEYYLRFHPNVRIIFGAFPPTILEFGVCNVNCPRSCSLPIRADKISILVHPLVRPKQFKSKTCLQLYCWWKKSCTTWHVWNSVNNGIFTISTGAGFLPPTVCIEIDLISLHQTISRCFYLEYWSNQTFYVSSFKTFVHPTEARRLDESKLQIKF